MKKILLIVSVLVSLLALYFCRDWYIGAHAKWDYYNFAVLGILFFLTIHCLANYVASLFCKHGESGQAPSPTKERMANIEFLRIVFTIAVLCSHFFKDMGIWNAGGVGVCFFFILSGFFLAMTFSPEKNTCDVLKNMIIRFTPLIVLGACLKCLFIEKMNVPCFFSEVFFISSTGMLKGPQYNGVSWYISILFWVTLLYFYMLKTRKRETANLWLGVIAFVGTIALCKRGCRTGMLLGDAGNLGFLFEMRVIYGLAMVAVGYFVYLLYHHIRERVTETMGLRIVCTLLELFALGYSIAFSFFHKAAQYNMAIIALTFSGLVLLFTLRIGYVSRLLEHRIWIRLSKYSLAVYLVQGFIVWSLFRYFLGRYEVFMLSHKALTAGVTLIACCVAGVWAHYVVEKPCGRFLKKYLG